MSEPRAVQTRSTPVTGAATVGLTAAALVAGHADLELVLETAQQGFWVSDLVTGAFSISAGFAQSLGFEPSALAARASWIARMHPDDRAHTLALRDEYLAGMIPRFETAFRFRAASGEWRWLEARGRVLARDADGHPTHFGGIHQDVTARHAQAAALEESETLFRALATASPAGVFMANAEGGIVYANPKLLAIYGMTMDEVRHEGWRRRVHPEDLATVIPRRDELTRLGLDVEVEYRLVMDDGSIRWVLSRAAPVRKPGEGQVRRVGTLLDITARRQAEETLAQRERALREAQRIARVGDWRVDGETMQVTWSEEHYRLAGVTPATFRPSIETTLACTHPDDRPVAQAAFDAMLADHAPKEWTQRLVLPDGTTRVCDLRAEPHLSPAGQLLAIVGVTRDVTEIRAAIEAEAAARADADMVHRQLDAVLASIPVGVLLADTTGAFVHANPAMHAIAARTLGAGACPQTIADLLQCDVYDTESGEAVPSHEWPFVQALHEETVTTSRMLDLRAPGGNKATFVFSAAPIRTGDGARAGAVLAALDATPMRELELQYRQALKMEALGQLAGGIAHDFNNVLTAVIASADYAAMLAKDSGLGAEIEEELATVRQAAMSATVLTRRLLAFSRQQPIRPRAITFDAVIRDAEKMLRRVLPANVTLDVALAAGAVPVLADPAQLDQVLMNLIVNARDAMPRGGTITLETSARTLMEDEDGLPAGRYATLVVRDTGIGMDPATLHHVFEPFFTTKGIGEGTGLGLATVYGIATQAGGAVRATSAPGQGATFTVLLPEHHAAGVAAASEAAIPGGDGRLVLVVEDETLVRRAISHMLEHAGYRVLAARHGGDALHLLGQHDHAADPIALVVTDVRMPEMSGPELALAVAQTYPGLPLVFMTGYMGGPGGGELTAADKALVDGYPLLNKPFVSTELLRIVRAALDAAAQV